MIQGPSTSAKGLPIHDFKNSHSGTDGEYTWCGDPFVVYTEITFWCAPDTNIMLYTNFTSIKKLLCDFKQIKSIFTLNIY